ncbi:MAG: hypothetical protein IT436_15915 [Phycisphaerales bacterium]|nr:hypothetical protein [Phycisphaerales bacterium]
MNKLITSCRSVGVYLVPVLSMVLCAHADAQLEVIGSAYNPSNQKTYLLLEASTWTQARDRAVELGGQLATVRSLAENTFIYDTFSRFGGSNKNLWIGLYDLDQAVNSTDRATRRLEFGWLSGEPASYARWSPVEPNNPQSPEPTTWEFYVHIWQPGDLNRGTWNNLQDRAAVFGVPIHGVVEIECVADFTGDGIVDFSDYLEFLNLYNDGDPLADLNGDGFVDFADYLAFLNRYDAGC